MPECVHEAHLQGPQGGPVTAENTGHGDTECCKDRDWPSSSNYQFRALNLEPGEDGRARAAQEPGTGSGWNPGDLTPEASGKLPMDRPPD